MLLIQLPDGRRVLHAGEFKFHGMTRRERWLLEARLRGLGPVEVMLCEALNAHLPGFTPEENTAVDGVAEIMARAPGRVIVALFASNLDRVQELALFALHCGRPISFAGSGMTFASELLQEQRGLALPVGDEPIDRSLIFATGCQAEPYSALHLEMIVGKPKLRLQDGDTVILSSRAIPGNEGRTRDLVVLLLARCCSVFIQEGETTNLGLTPHERLKEARVHVSGHGSAEDIRLAMNIVRPQRVVPSVRTSPQIEAFRQIADDLGVEVWEPEDPHHITL